MSYEYKITYLDLSRFMNDGFSETYKTENEAKEALIRHLKKYRPTRHTSVTIEKVKLLKYINFKDETEVPESIEDL